MTTAVGGEEEKVWEEEKAAEEVWEEEQRRRRKDGEDVPFILILSLIPLQTTLNSYVQFFFPPSLSLLPLHHDVRRSATASMAHVEMESCPNT